MHEDFKVGKDGGEHKIGTSMGKFSNVQVGEQSKSPTDLLNEAARGTKESVTQQQKRGGVPGSPAASEEAAGSIGLPSSNTGKSHALGIDAPTHSLSISVGLTSRSQIWCTFQLKNSLPCCRGLQVRLDDMLF